MPYIYLPYAETKVTAPHTGHATMTPLFGNSENATKAWPGTPPAPMVLTTGETVDFLKTCQRGCRKNTGVAV